MGRRRVAIAMMLLLASLAGCQRSDPIGVVTPLASSSSSSSTSASAIPATTPNPTATPTPTKQELVAEAEGRFREYLALQLKIEAAGGTTTLDPEIEGYIADPYRSVLLKSMSAMKQAGVHVEKTDLVTVTSITPIDERGIAGAVVALRVCLDGSRSVAVAQDGRTEAGPFILSDFWFIRDGLGVLRISTGVDLPDETC